MKTRLFFLFLLTTAGCTFSPRSREGHYVAGDVIVRVGDDATHQTVFMLMNKYKLDAVYLFEHNQSVLITKPFVVTPETDQSGFAVDSLAAREASSLIGEADRLAAMQNLLRGQPLSRYLLIRVVPGKEQMIVEELKKESEVLHAQLNYPPAAEG